MGILQNNNAEIYFEVHGRGEPLVLIPGVASDGRSWQPVLGSLAARRQVILVDNRGAGRTSSSGEITIEQMAEDAASVINHLDLQSADIMGHSMGGFIALEMALRFPDLVRKLILAASALSSSKQTVEFFSNIALQFNGESDREMYLRKLFSVIFSQSVLDNEIVVKQTLQAAMDDAWRQRPEDFKRQIEAVRHFDRSRSAGNISADTLIVAGERDNVFSVEECKRAAEGIPHAGFALIKDAPHAIHMEKGKAFLDVVFAFL